MWRGHVGRTSVNIKQQRQVACYFALPVVVVCSRGRAEAEPRPSRVEAEGAAWILGTPDTARGHSLVVCEKKKVSVLLSLCQNHRHTRTEDTTLQANMTRIRMDITFSDL